LTPPTRRERIPSGRGILANASPPVLIDFRLS
jgi:hypothetical protein